MTEPANQATTENRDQEPKRQEFQFGLWALLVATAFWAVFLALMQLIGFWLTLLVSIYLLAVTAIRTELGYRQGAVVAAVRTAIFFSVPVMAFSADLAVSLVAIPVGLAIGYCSCSLMHIVALAATGTIFAASPKKPEPHNAGSEEPGNT